MSGRWVRVLPVADSSADTALAEAIDYLDNILDDRCADAASIMRMIAMAREALASVPARSQDRRQEGGAADGPTAPFGAEQLPVVQKHSEPLPTIEEVQAIFREVRQRDPDALARSPDKLTLTVTVEELEVIDEGLAWHPGQHIPAVKSATEKVALASAGQPTHESDRT